MSHCRTKLRQSTVQFQGPKLWSSLPQHALNKPLLGSLKKSVKKFFGVEILS